MIFIGISRKIKFSPNRELADSEIFQSVVQNIEKNGYDVVKMSESVLIESGLPSGLTIDGIFHMTRSAEALDILNKIEREGVSVINSPQAVLNCGRALCAEYMSYDNSYFVKSLVISTDRLPVEWTTYPCWVKRGDTHSYIVDDVRFVTSADECVAVLGNLHSRGVRRAVLSPHIHGRVVKFYGVTKVDFFHWRMVSLEKESKFGLESYNDNHIVPSFDQEHFKEICFNSAKVLGVEVFGGDAIISERGKITLVDLNDWPSFSGCVQDAGLGIAKLIVEKSLSQ